MREILRMILFLIIGSVLIGPLLGLGFFILGVLFRIFAVLFLIGAICRLLNPLGWTWWGLW